MDLKRNSVVNVYNVNKGNTAKVNAELFIIVN